MVNLFIDCKPRSLEKRLHTTKDNAGGIYSAIRYTLISMRLIGILPLSGLSSPTSDKLRFTFRSPYTIIYVISMFGQCLMFFTTSYWLADSKISISRMSNFFFHFSSLTSSIVLMNIGRYWPQVILAVESIEANLPPITGNNTKVCNAIMALVFTGTLLEEILLVFLEYTEAFRTGSDDVVETFFRNGMPWIFDYTSYSLWKGVLCRIFIIQSTFIWSFNDLLIMVLSIYLTEHILVHNALLKRSIDQKHFTASELRIQYLDIVRLVRLVNERYGIYILTSFGSNLYWICTQLFNSLNYSSLEDGIEHTAYFTYSLSFIVLRTLLVLFLASRVHYNTKVPLIYLHGLPSEKFDVEVERYLIQINNIKVALTGLGFFSVTRTMILTLLGSIVTYELVLLQYNK